MIARPVPVSAKQNAAYRACLFPHEFDLIGNLRRFPLISRLRLDLLELSMTLESWQAFSYGEREALVLDSFDTAAEREALRQRIQREARRIFGTELTFAPAKPMADYRDTSAVPVAIIEHLKRFEVDLDQARWAQLSVLARFGLAKLSREGHDNRRLGPLLDDLFFAEFKQAPDADPA